LIVHDLRIQEFSERNQDANPSFHGIAWAMTKIDSKAGVQIVNHEPLPAPQTPRSPYHLSPEQIRFFDENGYLVLKHWITGELLERLQASGDRWIERGESLRAKQLAGVTLEPEESDLLTDLIFAKRTSAEVFFRVDYLHNKGEASSLELLGSPQVLAVAESLCGENFVPTYESMVFKKAGDGEKIPWHQDAVHTRKHRVFNFDLYLDESKIGGGALRVVPKSQRIIQDACGVAEAHAWDIPGVIQVELEPGDVLLHDVMVLHGSERTLGSKLRRTIYYEFRAAEMILEEGPWDSDWMTKRLQLIPGALDAFQAFDPHGQQFEWRASSEYRPALPSAALALKVAHNQHSPGAYCSATSAPAEVVARAMARLEVQAQE
jgi:ectoine hydroxylase-related dioxygenase (phytanoyl-CoA dioxygenase family)